jgi:hypothetical protein
LGVKKAKIGPQSPKTEFGAQNQYGRVIDPSIENFTWSKKKYTFGGPKGKNKVSEPANRGPKLSVISFRTKKIKTSRHFKKCMLKKFCRTQKKKTS